MRARTIRVRINPADADEYVIYADAGDTDGQRWLGQSYGRLLDRLGVWRQRDRLARVPADTPGLLKRLYELGP